MFVAARPGRRTQTATTASTPAPVGGWNARDGIAEMDEKDAVILDNWFPRTTDCKLRHGSAPWVTGMTGAVETLIEYASPTTRKLIAAADNAFYDVSASGTVGAAMTSGFQNNRWQHINFGTAGGHFIVAVNGQDSPRNYDGTTWATTPAITGFTAANAIHINAHKKRIWLTEKGTLKAWYLPVNSIGGAASEFDLYSIATKGGELMGMMTWTVDGGNGPDDLAVFVTSQGEAIIYAGTDPASATTWALVGVFQLGKPLGRRFFFKIAGDVVIMTEDGFYPLSKAIISAGANPRVALSDKISGAVSDAARSYHSNFGWQPILYTRGNMGIFNVPVTENGTAHQYVVNTQTGAWCRFTGMDGYSWSLFNDDLYFGTTGAVYKADYLNDDNGAAITGDMLPAFNYFGRRTSLKRFTMARPIFRAGGTVHPMIMMNVDFAQDAPRSTIFSNDSSGSPWDTSPWDTTSWGAGDLIRKAWQAASGIGYAGSLRVGVNTSTQDIALLSIDYVYEPGGVV